MTLLKCQPIENTWPTFEDVIDAYRSCVLRKNSKYQQILFETHLGNELIQLYNDLTNNTYYPKKSFSFLISEPKLREIFAPDFRDRIVHHLIVKKLEKFWVPKFSAQSFACIKGRGHHKALDELQRLVRKISKGARQDVHVLKMDIASFYVTIHRPTLWKIVEKTIRSPKLAKLTQMIIEHDARKNYKKIKSFTKESIPKHKSWLSQPRDCGIPIGNLTSQFFANVYLNELDHFITRKLKPMGYIRYMDDLLLLHRDPAEILNFISPIELWLLENRKQKIHPNKTIIANLCDGIEFLGYIVRQENFPKFPVQFYLPPIKNGNS